MYRKLRNDELNRLSAQEFKIAEKLPVAVVLDNVRSQHNIGSAFRTADSFLIEKVYLCGICAVPPTPEIHKSALGAEFSVEWEYFGKTSDAVTELIPMEKIEMPRIPDHFSESTSFSASAISIVCPGKAL